MSKFGPLRGSFWPFNERQRRKAAPQAPISAEGAAKANLCIGLSFKRRGMGGGNKGEGIQSPLGSCDSPTTWKTARFFIFSKTSLNFGYKKTFTNQTKMQHVLNWPTNNFSELIKQLLILSNVSPYNSRDYKAVIFARIFHYGLTSSSKICLSWSTRLFDVGWIIALNKVVNTTFQISN